MCSINEKRMIKNFIPKNSQKLQYPDLKGVFICTWLNDFDQPVAVAFRGRQLKPFFYYRFTSEESRENRINNFLERERTLIKEKQEAQDRKKAFKHSLKVDDILYASWGYDQTNIDFYQVVKVLTPKTVCIRKIGASKTECDGYLSGETSALKDCFIGDEIKKRVTFGNSIRVESFIRLSLWDGKPLRYSSYH